MFFIRDEHNNDIEIYQTKQFGILLSNWENGVDVEIDMFLQKFKTHISEYFVIATRPDDSINPDDYGEEHQIFWKYPKECTEIWNYSFEPIE